MSFGHINSQHLNRHGGGRRSPNPYASGRTLGQIINSPTFPIADRNKVIEIIDEIFSTYMPQEAFIVSSVPDGKVTPIIIHLNPNWDPKHKHFYNIVVEFMSQVFANRAHFNNEEKINKFFNGLMSPQKIKSFHGCGPYLRKTMQLLTRFCCPGDDVLIAFQEREHKQPTT